MLKIFILLLLIPLSTPFTVNAVTTPTPEEEATPTSSNIEEIQKIRQAVQEKVKEKLKEITSSTPLKKAILGSIIKIDGQELTVEYQNQNRILILNDDTALVDIKRNKIKISDLKVGQQILALGLLEENKMDTKRLLIIDLKLLKKPKQVIVGSVVDISKSSPILVVSPLKHKDQQLQIKTSSKTEIINKNGEKTGLSTISAGNKVIAILEPDPTNSKSFNAVKIINLSASTVTPVPTSSN